MIQDEPCTVVWTVADSITRWVWDYPNARDGVPPALILGGVSHHDSGTWSILEWLFRKRESRWLRRTSHGL